MEPGHTGFTDLGGFILEEVLSNGLGHWNDCSWPKAAPENFGFPAV